MERSSEKIGISPEGYVIKPLIVVNIDTLILLSDSLRDNKITFKEVFEQYYSMIKFNPKKVFRDQDDLMHKLSSTYNPSNILIENWMKRVYKNSYPSAGLLHSLLDQIKA